VRFSFISWGCRGRRGQLGNIPWGDQLEHALEGSLPGTGTGVGAGDIGSADDRGIEQFLVEQLPQVDELRQGAGANGENFRALFPEFGQLIRAQCGRAQERHNDVIIRAPSEDFQEISRSNADNAEGIDFETMGRGDFAARFFERVLKSDELRLTGGCFELLLRVADNDDDAAAGFAQFERFRAEDFAQGGMGTEIEAGRERTNRQEDDAPRGQDDEGGREDA
jgi:hypothetical protein